MTILYADRNLLACVKPVGMDAEHELPAALVAEVGSEIYTVHRLDKNVGGVMVFGRNKSAAAHLSRLIQEGRMIKEYLAQTHGDPPPEGELEDLLWKDSRQNKVFVVNRPRKGVKPARLSYRRLNEDTPALVLVRLYTGRSHQIRVQFASRKYPLLGDHKYGARDELTAPRLFSCRITLDDGAHSRVFTALPDWATELNL